MAKDNIGYQFIDRNSWPISTDQEFHLTIIEVLVEGSVTIVPAAFTPAICLSRHASQDSTDGVLMRRSPKRKRYLSFVDILKY